MAGLETVYATHNFIAENSDEISFNVGEPVIVLEKDDGYQDGWWQGRNIHGEIGLFPMNYTSFKQPTHQTLENKIDTLETAIKKMDITKPKGTTTNDLPPTPSISNSSRHSSTLPPQQQQPLTTSTSTNQIHSSSSSVSSYQPSSIYTNSSSHMAPASYQKKLSTKYVHQSVYTSLQNAQLKSSLPEDWSVEQVAIWLGLMGFSDIATTFEKQEITGDILLELNVESLKELNVSTFGKRFKIVNAIKVLADENIKRKESMDTQSDNNSTLHSSSLPPLTPSMTPPSSNTTTMTSNNTITYTDDDDLISDYSSIIKKTLHSSTTSPRLSAATTKTNDTASPSSSTSYPSSPNNKSPLMSPTIASSSNISTTSSNYNPLNPSDIAYLNSNNNVNTVINNTQPLMNNNTSGLIQRSATPLNRSLSTSSYQPTSYFNNNNKSSLNYSQSLNKSNTMYNISNPMSSVQPQHRVSVDQIGRSSMSSLKNTNSSQNNSKSRYNFVRNSFLNPAKSQNVLLTSSSRFSMDGIAQRLDKENSLPDMEGWLYKQGDKYKTWNKRWFVLKEANFFYFKSPKDTRMKGIINLHGYQVIADENINPGKYCFKLQHERERTFYFYTDTELGLKSWMSTLLKSTITRDYTSPVMSSSNIPTVSLDVARRMKPRPPSTIFGKEFDPERPLSSNSNYDSRPFSLTYSEQPQPIMRMSMSDETHHLYSNSNNNNQTQESGLLGNEDELGLSQQHRHHHSSLSSSLSSPPASPPPSSPPPPAPPQLQPLPSISSSSTITDRNKKKKINSMIYDDDEDLIDPLQRPSSSTSNQLSLHYNNIDYSSNKTDLTYQPEQQQRKDSFHIIHDRIEELDNENEDDDEEADDHNENRNKNRATSWQWDEKDYVQWINQHLMNNDNINNVKLNHITELRTGEYLILLLESISGKQVRKPASTLHHDPSIPLTNMQMLDCLVASFKFMGREGVLVDGRYTIKDIFSGNESKIIEMLRTIKDWANQLHPSSDKKASGCTFGENEEGILDELEEA
ncbi:hypothetical protein BJ944DRAFT_200818 [Cunninghamella echinulata]|nr:hypothetical protein BJ944DRAFT_200818 [Cunninghamella echinulata]